METLKIEAMPGDHISRVIDNAKEMIGFVKTWGFLYRNTQFPEWYRMNADVRYPEEWQRVALLQIDQVEFDFNGITVIVADDSDTELITRDFMNARKLDLLVVGPHPDKELSEEQLQRIQEYDTQAEIESQERRRQYREEQEQKQKEADAKLGDEQLELEHPEVWEKFVEVNQPNEKDHGYGLACCTYAERWAKLMQKEIKAGAKLEDIADRTSHEADVEGITGFMYGAAVGMLAQSWKYGKELNRWHNRQYGHDSDEGTVNPAILTISPKEEEEQGIED